MRSADYGTIMKVLKQLGNITKEPFVVRLDGKEEKFFPPSRVVISEKFFRSAKCKMCGKCCGKIKGVSLLYTYREVCSFASFLLPVLEVVHIKIGKVSDGERIVKVFMYRNDAICDFACKNSKGALVCSIHEAKPIHCALPVIEIDRTKDRARLIKRPRGRNWLFGCPIEFGLFDYSEFINWDLKCLKRLLVVADDLCLDTWLPEILCSLEEVAGKLATAKFSEANRMRFQLRRERVIYDRNDL